MHELTSGIDACNQDVVVAGGDGGAGIDGQGERDAAAGESVAEELTEQVMVVPAQVKLTAPLKPLIE